MITEQQAFNILEESIDEAFIKAHELANTSSGDITPDQLDTLNYLTKQLAKLMCLQIAQNNPGSIV